MARENISNGVLSSAFNGRSQLSIVEFLAREGRVCQQKTIADAIGASQPTISRSKKPLIESGVVREVDSGLVLSDEFVTPINDLIDAFEE